MAQTIKHRRGKLESVKDITPINGELIIASGSDLSVHQEGLLFVGVEGNVLTPANKVFTGSAAIDVTGNDYDHSIDGVPYYDTDDKKLIILGHGGNTDVEITHSVVDFKGSGIVSSSAQVSELAGINNSQITLNAGDGLEFSSGDGVFTLNQGSAEAFTIQLDLDSDGGLEFDSNEVRIKLDGNTIDRTSSGIKLSDENLNASLNAFTGSTNLTIAGETVAINGGTVTLAAMTNGSGIVSSSAAMEALINDSFAAAVVSEIDDDEIPIAKLSQDAITIGGTSVTLGNTLSNQALLEEVVGGTGIQSGSGDISGVTAGSGITGGGNSGTVVVALDSGSIAGDGLTAKSNGSGLDINASDFTGDGLEVNSSDIRIKLDGSTIDRSSDGIKLSDENLNTSLNAFTASAGDVVTLDVGIDNNNVLQANANVTDNDFLRIDGTQVEGRTAAQVKSDIGLGNVENTAISTFAGSANITTVGTIGTGTWQGTAIDKAYLDDEVLNTSLNSFTASNANTSLNSFTASAGDVVTLDVGIGNNNVLQATSDVADDDFLRVNGTKIEGRSASELLSDIGAQAALSSTSITIGDSTISLGGTDTTLTGLTDIDMTAADHTIFNGVGANTLTLGASTTDIVIAGNLTVSGTRTIVNTTTVQYDDNILELNGSGTANGGLHVRDAEGGTTVTGSLIWDTGEDYWSAGPVGSEKELARLNASPTNNTVLKSNSSGLLVDSALSDDGTAVTISSDLIISGLTASQIVVTNGSKQLTSSTDISSLTLTLDGGQF